MATMPRIRPPHLHRETTRHGKTVWFVRIGKGPRTRIRGDYGSPEFSQAYQAAADGTPLTDSRKVAKGSLAWLVAQYRESSAWLALSPATRRQRENIFKHVLASAGTEPANGITRKHIVAGLERRAKTPSQARNFLDAMRGLFEWASSAEHIRKDPTEGVKAPPRPKTQGFPAWNEDDIAKYEARWPIGTRERVWLDVLCFTGGRRGDASMLGKQHIRPGNVLSWRTEKGGEQIEVTIPILPALARTIEAGPCGDLTFICGAQGRPFTKESFGNMFSKAARAAGVPKSAHGVRKIAATRAADNGATVHQLMAIFGWKTPTMALHYTQEANRRRLAREAAHMLVNTAGKEGPDGKKASKERA